MKIARVVLLGIVIGTATLQTSGFAGNNMAQTKTSEVKGPQTMEKGRPFRIFNPDTMAKPTAGYSQVAEVHEEKLFTLRARLRWIDLETWWGKMISARRFSKCSKTSRQRWRRLAAILRVSSS